VCVCVCLCIRFWHFLKCTFIEIIGFILGSVTLTVKFYITLHNISVKVTFILRIGQTGRMQCPCLQKETAYILLYYFIVCILF